MNFFKERLNGLPKSPEQEAKGIISDMEKVPGLPERAWNFVKDTKNAAAFFAALEGASIFGGATALADTPGEKLNKANNQGKAPITVKNKAEVGSENKLGQQKPVDKELLSTLLFGISNQITRDFEEGKKIFYTGELNKLDEGIKIYDGKDVYNYRLILDENGRVRPYAEPVESAKIKIDKYAPGNYESSLHGKVRMPTNFEFLDEYKDLTANEKYAQGEIKGAKEAPEKIEKIIQGGASWTIKIRDIIDILKAKVKAGAIAYEDPDVSAEDKAILASELGRTVAIAKAYQVALDKAMEKMRR